MGRHSNPTGGLGGVVRQLRLDCSFTQAELAATAGLTPGHLAKIELGLATPSRRLLEQLATALGISVSALVEAGGHVPSVILEAFRETPEAMLRFAALSPAERKRRVKTDPDDADKRERERIRLMANRIARGGR